MKFGAFMMPNNPPERGIGAGHRHNLDYIGFLDRVGFDEVWIGEHYTTPWEPCPSPDLLIAQAIDRTERITFASGAFLLPYHHPAELAQRIAYLDHMAQGRLIVGVGAGGFPGDWAMFDVDAMAGQNRRMMAEALDIMVRFWTSDGPFEHRGEFWTARRPADNPPTRFHLQPYQQPHPPIAITALSPGSASLKLAGAGGYLPACIGLGDGYLRDNWRIVAEAADAAGRTARRSDWRLGRDVFVAETDREARRLALDGPIGRVWREYLLPLFKQFGMTGVMKHQPDVTDSDVTVEYLADHNWLVGSPTTVADKLARLQQESGGFGGLLTMAYDHLDHLTAWRESKQAFMNEVAPRFR